MKTNAQFKEQSPSTIDRTISPVDLINHPLRHSDIDYEFRPSFYWGPSADLVDAVLRNVQGTERWAMIRRRALAIWASGATHPDVAICLEGFAFLLRKLDRPKEAIPLEIRLRAIRTNTGAERAQTARANPA